jgi:hypothetical protein
VQLLHRPTNGDRRQDLGRPLLAQLATRSGATPAVAAGATGTATPTGEGDGGISKARVASGVALFAVGAAAVVVGAITWHRAGEPTDCRGSGASQTCTSTYGDRNLGIGLTAGGVVAAAVGGWLFASGFTYHGAQVAIGTNSVAIAGSF